MTIAESGLTMEILTIEDYMRAVIDNLWNEEKLKSLEYCENEKDCGYRSGLRFLKLEKTPETDEIAQRMIYRLEKPKIEKFKPAMPAQLGFAF